jgi:hypothetical protein
MILFYRNIHIWKCTDEELIFFHFYQPDVVSGYEPWVVNLKLLTDPAATWSTQVSLFYRLSRPSSGTFLWRIPGKIRSKPEKNQEMLLKKCVPTYTHFWSQSYDRELQRQRCKNLQRHK